MSVRIVLDAQAGSCGKGKISGYLARKDNINISINNFMTNAGHTWISSTGEKIITQHLPSSICSPNTQLYIGPGAAITPDVLFAEIIKYKHILKNRKININPRAAVILPEYIAQEKELIGSGSTFKGCSIAQSLKNIRISNNKLFGDWYTSIVANNPDKYKDIVDYIKISDSMQEINNAIDAGESVIIEGSQGTDLDINYGLDYPNTTSRQCHAGQLCADAGISPMLVTDIIMIMRPYPIRISNQSEIGTVFSGNYGNSNEISWNDIKTRCKAPSDIGFGEISTNTKKTRRVFEMNWERLQYAARLNRPTQIALNFAQYINWEAYKCTSYRTLPKEVINFKDKIESYIGVPVSLIGTGPMDNDIIDLRKNL